MHVVNRLGDLKSWLPWIIGILIALMSLAIGKLAVKRYSIQQEIKAEQREISLAGARNDELLTLLQYVQSPIYAEEQARLKFGLAKPGEKAAVVPDVNSGNTDNVAVTLIEKSNGDIESGQPNYQKWWNYFFASYEWQ